MGELNYTDKTPEAKLEKLINDYKTFFKGKEEETYYKQVVTYLLDYPMEPENHEIIQQLYNQITKTD